MRIVAASAAVGALLTLTPAAPTVPHKLLAALKHAQDPGSAVAMGVVLNGLLSKVGDLINQAQNAGNVVVVGAGGQIQMAIQAAQLAYQDQLDRSLNQITAEQKKVVDGLRAQVALLEKSTMDDVKQVAERGSTIANSIPFSKTLPQVMRYAPYYVLPSSPSAIALNVQGNFFDAARPGFEPSLRVSGRPVQRLASSTTTLAFLLPPGVLPAPTQGINYVSARLTVPYQEQCWLLLKCRRDGGFDMALVALPRTAGKLVFTTTKPTSEVERVTKTSRLFDQASEDDDKKNVQHCEQPDPGWTVDPASVQRHVEWSQGAEGNDRDWWWDNNTSNVGNACWNITTIHKQWGTSGKVRWRLTFTQQRTVNGSASSATEDVLGWGGSHLYILPGAGSSWTAKFVQFDGKTVDINGPLLDNSYLRVVPSGNTVLVATIP